MGLELLSQADYVLNACGRPVPPSGYRFVDLPKIIPFHSQYLTVENALGYAIIAAGDPNPGPATPNFLGGGASGFSALPATSGLASTLQARVGPFTFANKMLVFMFDQGAGKLRAFVSSNAGVSWAEQNAAAAPVFSAAQAATSGDPTFGACQSTRNPNLCFLCYFSGAGQDAALISFDMASGLWGTPKVSTITPVSTIDATSSDSGQGLAIYRPSDDSVFFITGVCVGNARTSVYYAQCFPNGTGWLNVWNLLGVALPNYAANPQGSSSQCGYLDNAGNICVAFQMGDGTGASTNEFLWFGRIHPDNTLSTMQQFAVLGAHAAGRYLMTMFCSSANTLYVGFHVNAGSTIYSGASADAPAWTANAGVFGGANFDWADISQIAGVVTAYVVQSDNQTIQSAVAPTFVTATTVMVLSTASLFTLFVAPFTAAAQLAAGPTQARIENLSNTLFIARGIMLQTDPVQVRIKWPSGRYWNQYPSNNPAASVNAGANFPQGTGANLYAFDEEMPIERGGKVAIEMSGPTPGGVDIQLWGIVRYLLKATGDDLAQVDGETCVIGYPAQAQSQKGPNCLIGYPVSAGAKGQSGSVMITDPVAELKARERFHCWPNGNILAPEWALGNQCDGEGGEPFTFLSDVYTVAAGGQSYGNVVVIPGRADVRIRRWRAIVTWSDGSGTPEVGFRSPSGYSVMGGDLIPINLGYWWPFFTTLLLKHGTSLIVDVGYPQFNTGTVTVQIEFDGVKL